MRVLVTGGSGFLGSHICEQLSKAGHTVVALVRKSSNKKFLETIPNVELAIGTIEDRKSIDAAMKGVDAVIHSAGLVKARTEAEFYECNTQGTVNLLESAIEHAPNLKRFVQVSSLEASGPSLDGKPVPLAQENPLSRYGRSKLAAEKECLARKDKLPVVILRPAAIYGPRDVEIFEMFKAVKNRQYPVVGDGSMVCCYSYGPDSAAACIRAIEADVPSGSIYFIDDGEPVALKVAVGEYLVEAMGTTPLFKIGLPLGVVKIAALGVEAYGKVRGKAVMLTREKVNVMRHSWVCESTKTRTDLGWEPSVGFREGLKKTAEWYRENGWL